MAICRSRAMKEKGGGWVDRRRGCPLPINTHTHTHTPKRKRKKKHLGQWWRERHLFESSMGTEGNTCSGEGEETQETKKTEG